MGLTFWFYVALFVIASLLAIWFKYLEHKDENAFFDRLHNDPDFAEAYHELHKYDDWEDSGYFDGR